MWIMKKTRQKTGPKHSSIERSEQRRLEKKGPEGGGGNKKIPLQKSREGLGCCQYVWCWG